METNFHRPGEQPEFLTAGGGVKATIGSVAPCFDAENTCFPTGVQSPEPALRGHGRFAFFDPATSKPIHSPLYSRFAAGVGAGVGAGPGTGAGTGARTDGGVFSCSYSCFCSTYQTDQKEAKRIPAGSGVKRDLRASPTIRILRTAVRENGRIAANNSLTGVFGR